MTFPKSKRGKVLTIIGSIILLALAVLIGKSIITNVFNTSDENIQAQLLKMTNEINKRCPFMMDSETRLDKTGTYRNSIYYYCTLINYSIGEVDVKYLIYKVKPALLNRIKTNPDMKFMRDNKVTFIYNYRDKSGIHIVSFKFTPQDYL
jgi:hypothetical protein